MLMSHNSPDLGGDPSKLPVMPKATGSPVLIGPSGMLKLERIKLGSGTHDESWLQALIFAYPELLPVAQIEPAFGTPLPAAREVACSHGSIDNLYLTPDGEIILVETKLWRNAQARREVVAQTLDYVSALMSMGYEAFEAAVCRAAGAKVKSLYAIVADAPDALDEASFIDAVSRNLTRGRMLILVLGDGIRQEAEALAGLLQSHAGAHFTFALVEIATWLDVASGTILAVPNTLVQTVLIERGILTFEQGVPQIKAVPVQAAKKAHSLSEEMFFEELAKKDPKLPKAIRDFLKLVEPLGVYPDLKASLNLKVDLPEMSKPLNLGYVGRNGQYWTNPVAWSLPGEQARRYNQRLADAIGGVIAPASNDGMYLSTNGTSAPLISALLPQHAERWIKAIEQLLDDIRASAREAA